VPIFDSCSAANAELLDYLNADLARDLMIKARLSIIDPGALGLAVPAVMALIERIENEMQTQR
jgi:hypothetical protein